MALVGSWLCYSETSPSQLLVSAHEPFERAEHAEADLETALLRHLLGFVCIPALPHHSPPKPLKSSTPKRHISMLSARDRRRTNVLQPSDSHGNSAPLDSGILQDTR